MTGAISLPFGSGTPTYAAGYVGLTLLQRINIQPVGSADIFFKTLQVYMQSTLGIFWNGEVRIYDAAGTLVYTGASSQRTVQIGQLFEIGDLGVGVELQPNVNYYVGFYTNPSTASTWRVGLNSTSMNLAGNPSTPSGYAGGNYGSAYVYNGTGFPGTLMTGTTQSIPGKITFDLEFSSNIQVKQSGVWVAGVNNVRQSGVWVDTGPVVAL